MALKVDADTVLTHFCYPKITFTTESEALQLLSHLPDPATVRGQEPFYGSTLLHHACSNGWYYVVRTLIEEHGCSVHCENSDGASPLHWACANGHLNIARFLIDHHADPSCQDIDGDTPLHHACYKGDLEIVKLLIEQKCDPMCVNNESQTPFHVARANRYLDIVKFLIDLRADPSCQAKDGNTPLHYYCEEGDQVIVKLLLEQKCDPKCVNNELKSPLHVACARGHLNIVRFLIDHHADPSCQDLDGNTPLHYANEDIAKFLIEQKCDSTYLSLLNKKLETPLHEALKQGYIEVAECLFDQTYNIIEKTEDLAKFTLGKDKHGYTLLHYACKIGNMDIVKFLIEQKCDPSCRDKDGKTPLHHACSYGNMDIVKFLIEQKCDPSCRDKGGKTPLHCACDSHSRGDGSLNIVKYLVKEVRCNPVQSDKYGDTPLSLAFKEGHADIVAFLFSSGIVNKLSPVQLQRELENSEHPDFLASIASHPFHPVFKVFVMGNSSAGKSTLVKAIQNRMTDTSLLGTISRQFGRVTGVEPHTAGIIPVHIESQELGHIIVYDFAGQHQYYSNHAALLESLVSSEGALVMVVIDLSKSNDENIRTLHYWNSIIQNHCAKHGNNPPVLVIASHSDVVIAQKEDPNKKISDILESLATSPGASLHVFGYLILNCTRLESSGLRNTCDIIAEHCTKFQENFDVNLQTHFLYHWIRMEFHGRTACRVSEIVSSIKGDENDESEEENDEQATPSSIGTPQSISDDPQEDECLKTLSDNGHILYLRNDRKVNNGWVILDKQVLLSEVSGTLFAPEKFKEHRDISSSTGVAPLSKIKEAFPNHDPKMIIGFLTHFEFCQRIGESESALISGSQMVSCQHQSETFYFFPALVSEDRPTESCKSIEQTHYKCGWSLQSTRPDQFLSPRFLHVLLLRLAFSFALAPEAADEDKACPVLKRRCNVWKEGIHWQNRDGVEAIVEVVEQNTAVTVMIGCLESRELDCVKLRSELIRTILETKEKFSGAVEMQESLLHPTELASYPLKDPILLTTFTITELATALGEGKPVITHKERQKQEMLATNSLLHFESYTCFNHKLLAELMDENNDESEISDDFLSDVGKVACSKIEVLKQVLEYNKSELRVAIGNCRRSPEYDTPEHHCYLLFRTWKMCTATPTYQAFRSALDKYSVFRGRNPLNIMVCLACVLPKLG